MKKILSILVITAMILSTFSVFGEVNAAAPACKAKALWVTKHHVGKVTLKWTKKSGQKVSGWQIKYKTRAYPKGKWSAWKYKNVKASAVTSDIKVPRNYIIEAHIRAKGDKTWSKGALTIPGGSKYQSMTKVFVKSGKKRINSITLTVGQKIKLTPDYEYSIKNYKKRPKFLPNNMLYDIGNKKLITITNSKGVKYKGGMLNGTATVKAVKAGSTTLVCRAPNGRTKTLKVKIKAKKPAAKKSATKKAATKKPATTKASSGSSATKTTNTPSDSSATKTTNAPKTINPVKTSTNGGGFNEGTQYSNWKNKEYDRLWKEKKLVIGSMLNIPMYVKDPATYPHGSLSRPIVEIYDSDVVVKYTLDGTDPAKVTGNVKEKFIVEKGVDFKGTPYETIKRDVNASYYKYTRDVYPIAYKYDKNGKPLPITYCGIIKKGEWNRKDYSGAKYFEIFPEYSRGYVGQSHCYWIKAYYKGKLIYESYEKGNYADNDPANTLKKMKSHCVLYGN